MIIEVKYTRKPCTLGRERGAFFFAIVLILSIMVKGVSNTALTRSQASRLRNGKNINYSRLTLLSGQKN